MILYHKDGSSVDVKHAVDIAELLSSGEYSKTAPAAGVKPALKSQKPIDKTQKKEVRDGSNSTS